MERKAVENSSQIASVGFDRATNTLEVEFKHGGVYQYEGVSFEMADAFVKAPSMGQFLGKYIKNHFPFKKVG